MKGKGVGLFGKTIASWFVISGAGIYAFLELAKHEEEKQRKKMKVRQKEEREKKKMLQFDLK